MEHQSRPLGSLKDPTAFGPPPKNVNYHGGAAVPNSTTPDRRGLGAPIDTAEVLAKERDEQRAAAEAARKPPPPPVPYRVNTTGLPTDTLPKPPVRRLEQEEQFTTSPASPNRKPKPSLPPRLSREQGSTSSQTEPSSPPPAYSVSAQSQASQDGHVNQGAISRLGSAGISVPGLGIGKNSEDPSPARQTAPPNPQGSHLNELQSRFAKFSTKPSTPESPSQGTSFAQKQAAVNTAQSFRNDPSSVSVADAKATATTANNFRERHGDQVAAGWQSAGSLNKKYDVTNKINAYASETSTPMDARSSPNPTSRGTNDFSIHKRAPPPPPGKPSAMSPSPSSPPPVPLSSKPKS